jgi:hypothetical protein
MPIYNEVVNAKEIRITINHELLNVTTTHIKDMTQPTCIYVYNYITELNEIEVNIEYDKIINIFKLPHITRDTQTNKELGLTTLFKDDYKLFPVFYKYYKQQGVSHFFMYYNGKITSEINEIFNLNDVTLIEWDYKYWNHGCKYQHHAQTGQIHHSIYRYGKDICNYMIFCDLDEYLSVPNNNILNFIFNNKDINIFGFCNRWSKTIDNKIPDAFPCIFLTSDIIHDYGSRSKNIYKLNSINTIGIHHPNQYYSRDKIIPNLTMFHFFNWTRLKREITDESFSEIEINIK